jgi:outer membrane putative beta-barrel porin/alpha-amylase
VTGATGGAIVPSRLTPFEGWIWAALVAAMIVAPARGVHAQALEPRSYVNTPVGINFLLLGYGYTEGDVGFDASSPVKDTKVHIHAGLLAYARSLDVWGLSGKVLAVLPVAEASGSAKVAGQGRDRQIFGLADPLLRISVNFFGAPALSIEEFPTYRQDLIVGGSLQVTAPLGQYDSTKLLNVGTNRWSLKPELGVSKAWGPVIVEMIPAVTFFTNNDDFFGGKTLEQAPIYSVQGHLIYEFFPALWAALNATYYAGGRTTIDGEKGEQLENVRLGLTAALSMSRYQSIKLSGSTGVYNRTDNSFWAVGIAWQYRWGGGL